MNSSNCVMVGIFEVVITTWGSKLICFKSLVENKKTTTLLKCRGFLNYFKFLIRCSNGGCE